MEFKPLKYLYKPASGKGNYTLLLLHGTGGNEHDLMPLAKFFDEDLNLLSVRGNVLENGLPRFFQRTGFGVFNEEDLKFRTHELVSFIKQLSAKEKFDSSKVIALGYSNGANIAGGILLLHPNFLAGAILFRPMRPLKDYEDFLNSNRTPIFITSGEIDRTLDSLDLAEYVVLLRKSGFQVDANELNAGHELTQVDIDLAVKWYFENFG